MNNLILTPVPLDELISKIREVIKEEVRAEQQKTTEGQMLSQDDTCKVFSPAISRVTLRAWTNAGHLTRYDIGGRAYYKYGEVIEAAKNLRKYKNKKL